jgi:phosphonate transport system ATP-binding protein
MSAPHTTAPPTTAGHTAAGHTAAAHAVASRDDAPGDPVVEVRGLVKAFGTTRACDGLDLTVRQGELLGLVGRSGSGKSTLLRHLNALTRPDSGTVRVLGTDLADARGRDLRALRRRVGVVFQQFNLIGRLTVMENVLTGALGRVRVPRYGIVTWPRAARREALGHLERVGLADRAYQRADSLSGGQQQRVAIARMLMQRPDLVLADEPVASLDPESAATVMGLLFQICLEDRLTVICTLHQTDLALAWTRRMVGLREGRIVLDAATADLDRDQVGRVYTGPPAEPAGPTPAADTAHGTNTARGADASQGTDATRGVEAAQGTDTARGTDTVHGAGAAQGAEVVRAAGAVPEEAGFRAAS